MAGQLQQFESDDVTSVRSLEAQLPEHVVPMPDQVFKNKDWDKYESIVDDYIAKNKLKPDDTFRVEHPEGPEYYKYNGKNSGGRKDWQRIEPAGKKFIGQAASDLGIG